MTNATVESATKLTDEFDKWQAELTSLLSDLAHKDGADGARAEGLGQFLPTLRAAIAALQASPLPEGVKARFKCEDCDGTGYTGEMIPGSEFQPPEPVGCTSCRFTGWWAECEAYSADQMHAYLDADRASSCAAQAAPFAKDSWQHAVDNQLVAFGRTSQEFANPHEALAWLAIVNMELGQSNVGAAQAVRMLTEVRFCYESMKPIEDFDAIYAEYATTFCRYPDDFMAKVVRQTKEDLFLWCGAHREKIRAGLVLLAAQEDANRTIPADGKIGGAA